MLRTSSSRVLDGRDLDEVRELLARDPVADCFLASRVESAGLDSWRLGAEVWGYGERGRLEAVCYSGANLVPAQAGPGAVRAFADRARRQGRRCSSIVGRSEAVDA
ncbi:MAG: GCN5-related N-acetyltransferase, partial [Frankiales bacterium]|nr:GCN5-related N-acetyltransferase [Frankiales bacterium]